MTSNPLSHLNVPRPFSPSVRQRNNRSPAQGSATQTVTSTPDRSESPDPLVLRLRGAHTPVSLSDSADDTTQRRRPRIQWAEDVIDNEGLGRKKSKVCCIYHKPRPAGESSDESSSDSSSDDTDSDDGRDGARPIAGQNGRGRLHRHGHENGHGHRDGDDDGCADHDHTHGSDGKSGKQGKPKRRPSPNAYEKMPKYDVKPLTRQPGAGS